MPDETTDTLVQPMADKTELKILVVDDLPMNVTMMVMMLEKLGLKSDTAENGQLAVEKQQQQQYDLIFMDWEMPVLDGIEATKQIRQQTKSSEQSPWIIALTANASIRYKDICIEAGMNDYLAKPIAIDDLAARLKSLTVSPA